MRGFVLSFLSLAACRTQYVKVDPVSVVELAVEARGQLLFPEGCELEPSQVSASLVFDSVVAPCPLEVRKMRDRLVFSGTCALFGGAQTRMTLRVNAVGGTAPVVAEVVGVGDFTVATQPTVFIAFDDEDAPGLAPKTKAAPAETVLEQRRFNCDIDGEDGCTLTPTAACGCAPTATPIENATDTCSNLEELCAGTLFASAANQCPE